ncbi:MAG: HAD-IA family hydrolase, partial [Steroidobacteraceae bacterium]
FTQMLNELGLAVTVEQVFEQFVGKSLTECLEKAAQLLKRDVPEDFTQSYRERSAAALTRELKAVPGIERVLQAIQVPYCVASNGTMEKMQATLGLTGLLPRFKGRLFGISEVARGKPHPDIFLYAAQKSGASPSACAVIEDTVTGVAAGVAAGMTVFGYCANTPAQRLIDAGAHYTFDCMSELLDLLRNPVDRVRGDTCSTQS